MPPSTLLITTGPATVLDSGQVTCFGGYPLTFALGVDDQAVRFQLGFTRDPEVSGVSVHTEEIDDGYRVICTNFDQPDGRGTAIPVVLKEVGADVVLVHFRVFLFGNTPDRTVHYTFYRVPMVDLQALLARLTGG